ncbi:MAG: DHH family phosphoesterase [Candidatus Micrarchaeota archaeon]|nr:DHH family phosphoesterase [Candidatus Micrarchaeota archaeon]
MKNLDLKELAKLLESYRNKRIVVTTHSMADSDGIASALILSRYLRGATVVAPKVITRNAMRMLKAAGYSREISTTAPSRADLIVMVDTNTMSSLDHLGKYVKRSKAPKLVIDHHVYPRYDIPNASIFDSEDYNSTSSIIFELCGLLQIPLDRKDAMLLLYGIIADSADLQNATPQTFAQLSSLLSVAGISYQKVYASIAEHAAPDVRYLAIMDLLNSKVELENGYVIMYGKTNGHANAIAERALKMGADAAVFLSESASEASISARMRAPLDKELSLHLGRIMQDVAPMIGGTGGGHPCAAGAYGPVREHAPDALDAAVEGIRRGMKR